MGWIWVGVGGGGKNGGGVGIRRWVAAESLELLITWLKDI